MKITFLTLALTCLGQMFETFSSPTGKDMVVFTPPKAGTPPFQMGKSVSVSERCSDQGYLTSYPQPGSLGDLYGTRKCFDYCYSLSFKAAVCLEHSCMCLTSNPTAIPSAFDETLSRSYKKVSSGGNDMAVFTPPKRGFLPFRKGKSVSVSERCSVYGYLTSYPQPGPLGDLNGTRKCYDYCYSLSFKGAYMCLRYNPTA